MAKRLLFTRRRDASGFGPSELRNPEIALHNFRRRLSLVAALVFVAFCGLFARFFYLQVVQHAHFETLAETNRIAIVPIVPNRGVVTDRNGIVLAQSYSAYTLEITPSRVANLDATIDKLSEVVDVEPRDRKRFKKLLEESKNFESLPIRTKLTDEEVARFAVNRYRFPGVDIKARLFRQYPFGEVASHVIGYIGRINDKDNERIAAWDETANYKGSDYIGKVGIELSYERELHGTTGVEDVEVDAGGRAVRTLKRTPPIAGNNVELSLDIRLQQVAEAAFGDRRGALVAIDPTSGEVLAFVSKPGFDPNLFVDGIDPANWQELNDSPDKPLLNRPLRGAYPPGSTIKPYLALAALTSGKRTPNQTIFDPGFFQIPGQAHRFRDDKPGGHGTVDMYKSIVQSCDTYYYMLANDTDIDDNARFLAKLGFGQKTGIDIEGELTGVLPSREWKRQRFAGRNYRDEHRKWYLGDSISAGIGQGYNAFTPMQLAHAIAMIANDGVGYAPHLVKTITNVKTGEVREIGREPTGRLNVRPADLAFIQRALAGVPKEGTSAAAFKDVKYASAGKTGTAQVFSLKGEKYSEHHVDERMRDHAWYIYIRGEYPDAERLLGGAIRQSAEAGLLGELDIEIRRGAGAYICGEETALFESIEGKRGEPRNKPPFPVEVGLFGKPTAINNVETLVNVPWIVGEDGAAAAWKATGTEGSPGLKVFCVSGDVASPGVYEVPFGVTLRGLLELAGGVRGGRRIQAVLLGGAAGVFVGPDALDVPLTFEGTRAIGATLGSGVVMVFDETADMVGALTRIARFFRDESCGQCVPCRVGTVRQEELLARLAAGRMNGTRDGELALLTELGRVMRDASICGLGQTASSAIESAFRQPGMVAL